jgi:Protein of unknown function (DUF4232)
MKNPVKVQEMVRRRVRRRTLWRRTRVGVLVAVGVIATGSAAFGIDRMVVALHRYYGGQPHPAGHAGTAATSTTPPTTAAPTGPPVCVAADMTGAMTNWQSTNGVTYEIVTLTNISSSPCTLSGFPSLGANAPNGSALPAAARDVTSLGATPSTPASGPTAVTVAQGAGSWFELAFGDNCTQVLNPGAAASTATGDCYAGQWLQVFPPKTTSAVLVNQPLKFDYQTSGFEVGPFMAPPPPSSPPVPG